MAECVENRSVCNLRTARRRRLRAYFVGSGTWHKLALLAVLATWRTCHLVVPPRCRGSFVGQLRVVQRAACLRLPLQTSLLALVRRAPQRA